MNISGISATASVASVGMSSSGSSVNNVAPNTSSSANSNNFMQDVFQALKSVGVNLPPPPPAWFC